MVSMQLFAGLYLPVTTAVIGGIYLVGRKLYSIGYIRNGPKGRAIGASIIMKIHGIMPIYTMISVGLLARKANKLEWNEFLEDENICYDRQNILTALKGAVGTFYN